MGIWLAPVLLVGAMGQSPATSLVGTVRDAESGRVLVAAEVSLGEVEMGVLTDEYGRYELRLVPPGPQHLRVRALGYGARTIHALVPVEGVLRIDVALVARPIPVEGLDVHGPPGFGRASPYRPVDADRSMTGRDLRTHPLLAEGDAFQAFVGEAHSDPEAPVGLHVRGGDTDQVAYLLDGIPILSPVHSAGLFSTWSVDALSGVSLSASSPSPALGSALSGVVSGSVREAGQRLGVESTLSSTHGSTTVHGPLFGKLGFVASIRSGFPGGMPSRGEPSYLHGESGDRLLRLTRPVLGGQVALLSYAAESELRAGVIPPTDPSLGNAFEWTDESLGVRWLRSWSAVELELKAWRSEARAGADWRDEAGAVRLRASQADAGGQVTAKLSTGWGEQDFGFRLHRIRADYSVSGSSYDGTAGVLGVFGEHRFDLGHGWRGRVGSVVETGSAGDRFSPRGELVWKGDGGWRLSLAAARTHQNTQSLHNSESVVRHVFPADLVVLVGDDVPAPRSDQLVATVRWRPIPALDVGLQGYVRRLERLVLVAPADARAFSSGSFAVGSGRAAGGSVEASGSGARYRWLADYSYERVRLEGPGGSYTPSYAPRHRVDAGINVHPSPTWSLRLASTAVLGRRSTDVGGPFEWEACNLLDGGCEFAGSPRAVGTPGQRQLPTYVRVDVGARKHWHVGVLERQTEIGLFGTVSNIFGRTNVLGFISGSGVGPSTPIEMRPVAPLVVGLDWRF